MVHAKQISARGIAVGSEWHGRGESVYVMEVWKFMRWMSLWWMCLW